MVPTGGKGGALTRLASDVQNAVGLTTGGERRFPFYPHGRLATRARKEHWFRRLVAAHGVPEK